MVQYDASGRGVIQRAAHSAALRSDGSIEETDQADRCGISRRRSGRQLAGTVRCEERHVEAIVHSVLLALPFTLTLTFTSELVSFTVVLTLKPHISTRVHVHRALSVTHSC